MLWVSRLKEWLEEAGVKEQEAELPERALSSKQGTVAGHDLPSQHNGT